MPLACSVFTETNGIWALVALEAAVLGAEISRIFRDRRADGARDRTFVRAAIRYIDHHERLLRAEQGVSVELPPRHAAPEGAMLDLDFAMVALHDEEKSGVRPGDGSATRAAKAALAAVPKRLR